MVLPPALVLVSLAPALVLVSLTLALVPLVLPLLAPVPLQVPLQVPLLVPLLPVLPVTLLLLCSGSPPQTSNSTSRDLLCARLIADTNCAIG